MATLSDIPPEKIAEYRALGYTDNDINQALMEITAEEQSPLMQSYNTAKQAQMQDARKFASNTLIARSFNENLIQWQLELDSILERVEHMLRGDKPKFINGSLIFCPPDSTEEKVMTDFGVAETMRHLSMYLNRNTILSNYDEKTINEKVYDFGMEISDLIFLKYETMFAYPSFKEALIKLFGRTYGTDKDFSLIKYDEFNYAIKRYVEGKESLEELKLPDEVVAKCLKELAKQKLEKRKLYPMLVRELVDVVHSSYLRALHGKERESLHEARTISQTEALTGGAGINVNVGQQRQERGLLNPLRWVLGKYK